MLFKSHLLPQSHWRLLESWPGQSYKPEPDACCHRIYSLHDIYQSRMYKIDSHSVLEHKLIVDPPAEFAQSSILNLHDRQRHERYLVLDSF